MGGEEGRSLRGSCFAGHRSQQPAASYITCLPPSHHHRRHRCHNLQQCQQPVASHTTCLSIVNKITFVDPIQCKHILTGQAPPAWSVSPNPYLLSTKCCFLHLFVSNRSLLNILIVYNFILFGNKSIHNNDLKPLICNAVVSFKKPIKMFSVEICCHFQHLIIIMIITLNHTYLLLYGLGRGKRAYNTTISKLASNAGW